MGTGLVVTLDKPMTGRGSKIRETRADLWPRQAGPNIEVTRAGMKDAIVSVCRGTPRRTTDAN